MMKKTRFIMYSLLSLCAFLFFQYGQALWQPMVLKVTGTYTVSEMVDKYGEKTKQQLEPFFRKAGIQYPPKKLALISFKDSKVLELWASDNESNYSFIKAYTIKAASGKLGPKLREGDHQVPEGMYKIIGLNPNSSYHLSMKLNYPNPFDLKHAKAESRHEPGTNIFIHGRAVSVGCLAMGDPAIEELFSLVHATGKENTTVLISPTDPSKSTLTVPENAPSWTPVLYEKITNKYRQITRLKTK